MSVSTDELRMLECLLNRFYVPYTTNEEKKELEAQLHQLRVTKFNWQYCLENLDKFHNQYLWFFGSTTVEAALHHWPALSASDRQQLRAGLIKLLSNYTEATPALHREKIAQILSLVASYQFPTEYPEYIEHILQLLKERFPIGVALARALGDSVMQEKYELSLQQRERFKASLTPHIPALLRALGPYMAYYLASISAPPSGGHPAATLQQHMNDLLQLVQQYFTWMEVQGVEPTLVEALLQASRLHPDTDETEVPVSALMTLAELYYRQQLLAPAISKLMVLGVAELMRQPGLPAADELYQVKVGDLARLCLGRELLAKHGPDWEPFFDALYQFTASTGVAGFIERLGMWNNLYQMATSELAGGTDPTLHRLLWEVYPLKIATLTMERMLHPHEAHRELLVVGDIFGHEEEVLELQQYHSLSLELVENVSEVAPQQMYESWLSQLATNGASPYRQGVQLLHSIAKAPDAMHDTDGCITSFIPACQLLARLCVALRGKVPAHATAVRWLAQEQLELFTQLTDCAMPLDLVFKQLRNSAKLAFGVAQVLNAFRALLPLVCTGRGASEDGEPAAITEQQLTRLVGQLTKYLLLPEHVDHHDWKPLANAAASLLLHVVSGQLLPARTVYEQLGQTFLASNVFFHEVSTRQMIRRAVLDTLLAKWNAGSVADGQLAVRRAYLARYVHTMAQTVMTIEPTAWLVAYETSGRYRSQLHYFYELQDLTELLRHYREHDTGSKALLASAVQGVIQRALYIYSETGGRGLPKPRTAERYAYCPNDDADDDPLAAFCHAAIEALQVQLGEPFLQEMIRLFLGQVRADAYAVQRHSSLTTLLRIFVLIVQQPGNRTLIGDIVQLSVEHVLPVALGTDHPLTPQAHAQLCLALFELFHAVLLYRWRYFVRPQAPSAAAAAAAEPQLPSVANEGQYRAILQGYGVTLMSSHDPQVVQELLESLQLLNERCHLFREPFFATQYAASFTHAVLHLLVEPQGDLHRDQLIELLYALATSDRRMAYDLTITVFPTFQPELREELCQCTDMPTFARLVKQFINMARASRIGRLPDIAASFSSEYSCD